MSKRLGYPEALGCLFVAGSFHSFCTTTLPLRKSSIRHYGISPTAQSYPSRELAIAVRNGSSR